MTSYLIRGAVAADVEGILALDRLTKTLPHWTPMEYLAALPLVRPETSRERSATQGTERCLFVAEGASIIAGFAVGKATVLDTEVLAELESVGVAVSARRSGIGRALCSAVIEWSRGLGATDVDLEVRSASLGPIALYEGLGFARVGLRGSYYRQPVDDAILMRLSLASSRWQEPIDKRDL